MQVLTFLKVKEIEVDLPTDTLNPTAVIIGISTGSCRKTYNKIEYGVSKTHILSSAYNI